MNDCFFCNPDQGRILYESDSFYVLLGLGPVVEGYSILVAKSHFRSMLDLPINLRTEYAREKLRLRNMVEAAYGSVIVTEHGRVQACASDSEDGHEPMCFHAHQLFFPVDANLAAELQRWPFQQVFIGQNLFDLAPSLLGDDDEYLLFESSAGQVHGYAVQGKCPRQLMRFLVAQAVGQPELADWRKHPRWPEIEKARARYSDARSLDVSRN